MCKETMDAVQAASEGVANNLSYSSIGEAQVKMHTGPPTS